MLYYLKTIFFVCLMTTAIHAQNLNTAIQNLANAPEMQYGLLGVCVMDAQTGKIIAQRNTNKAFTPASIMKTLTTATSIGVLGQDYKFKTYLEHDGYITSEGVLKGNLYITGTGDPMLGSTMVKSNETPQVKKLDAVLSDLLVAVQKVGITKIEGHIIGDDTYFTTEMPMASWQWNDIGNYYGAGASGLNIHENLYYLDFGRTNTVGKLTTIAKITPEMPYLTFNNEVKTDARGTGDNAYVFGSPRTYLRYVRGTIPVGKTNFRIKGAIPDPAYYAAYALTETLQQNGIKTTKIPTTQLELKRTSQAKYDARSKLLTIESPTLRKIIQRANEKSVNLYCESLLKAMGKKRWAKGSSAAGVKTVEEFWKNRGVNMDGLFIDDGSGLSPRNAITPQGLATILSKVYRDKGLFEPFYASLPIGGRTGTVRYLFPRAKGDGSRIRVKSGSMRRVRAYAGYAKTRSGKMMSFVMIANNFTGKSIPIRKKMETIMLAIARLP